MIVVIFMGPNSSTTITNCCNECKLLRCKVIFIVFPFLVKLLIRCQEWTWMVLFENINNWRCPMFFGAGHSQNTNNWGHTQILWDLSFQWSANLFWYISAFSGRCACSILHWNICARGIMFCFLLLKWPVFVEWWLPYAFRGLHGTKMNY